MKITLEPTEMDKVFNCNHPKISIEIEGDNHTLPFIFSDLIIPALLAFSFSKAAIDEYITLD